MKPIFLLSLVFAVSTPSRADESAPPRIQTPPPAASPPLASVKTNAPAGPLQVYNEHDPLLGYQIASAAKGFPQSQYVMALRYLSGNGVPKDEAKAREYLEAASKKGHLPSRQKLRQLDLAKMRKLPLPKL